MTNKQWELKLFNSPRLLAVLAEGQRQIEAGEYRTIEEFRKRLEQKAARSGARGRKASRKKPGVKG